MSTAKMPTGLAGELLRLSLAQQQEHAIILLDPGGVVVDWLPGAYKTFGWRREEMIGQSLERLFTQADLDRGDMDWELRAARSYGKSEDDRWMLRKDGVQIWVAGIVTGLNEGETLVGFCKLCRDRTDLRSRIETLQSRVDQAADAQHERHLMLGTLAHELRNPLAPLKNAAELIRLATPDKPAVGNYVNIIDRQIRFIDTVLEDLLESTRVNVGKAKLHYTRFEARAAIDAALETCSAMLREQRQLVHVLLPDHVNLEADAVRLQQVIVNLITNSSKFSPAGASIWIKGTVDADEFVMRVEDQGRGIPSELVPKIFDLFTQAGPEGADSGAGLGLGLGLVKSIVELHGGTVQARSEGAGKGAEMIVRLPLCPGIHAPTPLNTGALPES